MSPHRRGSSRTWFLVALTVVLLVLGVVFTTGRIGSPRTDRSPVITLRNGQQLIIEAVTYDTNVVLGRRDWVGERLGRWLPSRLTEWLAPVRGQTRWSSDTPEFTVWLNGYDPARDQFVDCQGYRLDIVDEAGDLYPALARAWYGFSRFSRVAHGFPAFPRRGETLQLRVTSFRTNDSYSVTIPNPHRVSEIPAWTASAPPQARTDDGLEIRLAGFLQKTNGGPDRIWESPSQHWWPRIELRQNESPASGWLEPEWWAEDPTGNRGQTLGLHEPIQRFHIQAFPAATNAILDSVAAVLPTVQLAELGSGIQWSRSGTTGPVTFYTIGILPAGMHLFTGGNLTTNPPPGGPVAPVMGGAPSGWVGISAQITPKRLQSWDGHYTPVPTLYLRAPTIPGDDRIAVRVRDDQGRLWTAEPEGQGRRENVRPFLLAIPPDVRSITPEVVFIRPRTAEFTVQMPAP